MEERAREKSLPRLNLRPFLVLAVGLICGIYLSYRASVGVRPADALVFALFLLLLAPPFVLLFLRRYDWARGCFPSRVPILRRAPGRESTR